RAGKYLTALGLGILGAVDAVCARLGATPAQVSLAWLMAKITAPIASATSLAQLGELMASAELKLDGEAMAALDAAGAPWR
ncbi:MAG: aldo/keto reductase, partial [Caulobacteraceae bacterium]